MDSNYYVFVVPGSHFDLGWCATIGECLSWGDEVIKRAIDAILHRFPEYKFTIEYTLFLKHFLETHPEYKEIVKRLISEKKIQVCSTMVGAMEQILDGEILIREITNAKRWIKEELGIDVKTVQHSDLPGHTIQLPQILQKSGIENISYSRFHPPIPLHWWEAPDGSRVLACNHIHGYGWGFILLDKEKGKEKLVKEIEDLSSIWPSYNILMLQESDLLLPEPEITERIVQLNKELREVNLKIAILDEFFEAVREGKVKLLVYKGEFPYGFYSLPATSPVTYREARIAENKLTSAEKLASIREILGLGNYPAERIDQAWSSLFYCHDHNVSGRRGELNNEVRTLKASYARIEAEELIREFLLSIGINIKTTQNGEPIVVYNPLNWDRSEVILCHMKFPGEDIRGVIVKDKNGEDMPVQIVKTERAKEERVDFCNLNLVRVDFLFLAKDIPSLGYKTFYAYPVKEERKEDYVKAIPFSIENRFYRIELVKDEVKVFWKAKNIELSREDFGKIFVIEDLRWDLEDALEEQAEKEGIPSIIWEEGYEPGEYLKVKKENFTGRRWKFCKEDARIIENGPIRSILRIEGKVLDSPIIEDIILYNELNRIDFRVTIDWKGIKNTQVRVKFPFNIPEGKITYEVPFYGVELERDEMPNTYRGNGGRFVQKWIDISNRDFGVTFATQNCSHILYGTTVEALILRDTYSCGDPFVWSINKGIYTFNFSLTPHEGDWKRSSSYKLGWEFNNPLEFFIPNVIEPIKIVNSKLPEEFSFCKIDVPNIVITTLKKSFTHSEMWVLRCFDAEGKGGEVKVMLPFRLLEVWDSNFLEEPLEKLKVNGKCFHVNLKPNEIKNILLKFYKEG